MHAIVTKYIGPSNTKGARIKATWERWDGSPQKSVTLSYASAFSVRDNHAFAAMKLIRMATDAGSEQWQCGETKSGYVFVCVGEHYSRDFGKGLV